MNSLFTPKKVLKLTEQHMRNAMQNAAQYSSAIFRDAPPTVHVDLKKEYRKIGFLTKLGVFLRWGAYTITALVAVLCAYIGFYGYPPALRRIELQFIESKVEEIAASLAVVEDKVTLQQIAIDKEIKKKNK